MSVLVTPRGGVLVATVRARGDHDPLAELTGMLANLTDNQERVVLDLSGATLAPYARVAALMESLARRVEESGCKIVVVADRLSARQVLRRLSPGGAVPVVPSVPVASAEQPPAKPVSAVRALGRPISSSTRVRGRRDRQLGVIWMRRIGFLPR